MIITTSMEFSYHEMLSTKFQEHSCKPVEVNYYKSKKKLSYSIIYINTTSICTTGYLFYNNNEYDV